jgi:hypothetical protein
MLKLLTHLWNTRATFSNNQIFLYGDDLASCFCQRQLALAFAATNTSMYEKYLIISTGNRFGGRWGPANNELLARARSKICEWMYKHADYQLQLNYDEIQRNCKVVLTKHNTPLAKAKVDTPDQLQYMMPAAPNSKYF